MKYTFKYLEISLVLEVVYPTKPEIEKCDNRLNFIHMAKSCDAYRLNSPYLKALNNKYLIAWIIYNIFSSQEHNVLKASCCDHYMPASGRPSVSPSTLL